MNQNHGIKTNLYRNLIKEYYKICMVKHFSIQHWEQKPLMVLHLIYTSRVNLYSSLTKRKILPTICSLSPCIAIDGNPLCDNQCCKASAPFFVSTNIKVKAFCNISIKYVDIQLNLSLKQFENKDFNETLDNFPCFFLFHLVLRIGGYTLPLVKIALCE